ncbi:LapA family protein [Amaricoccus tamworthensis]|uniref:LapA family protein n=1 Tax=Amaricoccus tamworthensis TaxID=57002 RepID=UPI003C7984BB
MRTVKIIILAVILLAIVVLSVANRELVTLNMLPSALDHLMPGMRFEVPLFVVILCSIVIGLVIGYLFEYLREYKHRRLASQKIREADNLKREMEGLRREVNKPKDDVLAILGN